MDHLSIHLKPSLRLTILLTLAHLVAACLLWPLALPWGTKLFIAVLIAISASYYLRQDALLTDSQAVVAFELTDAAQCTVTTRSGATITCQVMENTFVSPYLTVIQLKPRGQFFARSVVILPDSIEVEPFRQLRVWLRWKWKRED